MLSWCGVVVTMELNYMGQEIPGIDLWPAMSLHWNLRQSLVSFPSLLSYARHGIIILTYLKRL